jgi:hypothetical protein
MMPAPYGHQSYAPYPAGYPHGKPLILLYSFSNLSGLSGEYESKGHLSSGLTTSQASYPSSYAPSPAMTGTSPALGSRHGSAEAEQPAGTADHYYSQYSYSMPMISAPATSGYSAYSSVATTAGIPSLSNLAYAPEPAQQPPMYMTSYSSAPSYHLPTPSYGQLPANSNSLDIPPGGNMERPVDGGSRESRCWDHGCNGRSFSTHSNLLRHQREKDGKSNKSTCPKCGASFTRKTAMEGHMSQNKCRKGGRGALRHAPSSDGGLKMLR